MLFLYKMLMVFVAPVNIFFYFNFPDTLSRLNPLDISFRDIRAMIFGFRNRWISF